MHSILGFGMMDLVRASKGLIDAATKIGHAVGGIQALVGIHLPSIVGVGRDLPATHVDGFQSTFHLLNGLVPRHGTEGGNVRVAVQKVPKPFCALPSQGVFDVEGTAQPFDVLRGVRPGDPCPARAQLPFHCHV